MSDTAAGRKKTILIISALLLVALSPFVIILNSPVQKAYADGLFREEIPANIGDRKAKLSVQINPPILTEETKGNAFLQFRLFDSNNNKTIDHSTFFIKVTRGIDPEGQQPLLLDFFHTHDGILTIKVNPKEGERKIYATIDDILQAYVADPGGSIRVDSPILLDGGLYHFEIEIFGIDNDRIIFAPGQAPKFDSYLSVGDISTHSVEAGGQNYDTTIISYYDKISNFKFDQEKSTMSWSMPFDWNTTRLQGASVFVHEEIKIPVAFEQFAGTNSFSATVNGIPLPDAKIAVDPFSSTTEKIVHYLIDKSSLVSMSREVQEGTTEMQFTLTPKDRAQAQTTGHMTTDQGGIAIGIDWEPDNLDASSESTVNLKFSDAFLGGSLDSDVNYNMMIINENGAEVFRKDGLTAKGSTDTQKIDFPRNEIYNIKVEVTGLAKDGQTEDKTRNGIATGIVVVPEFPVGALTIIGGIFAAIILLQRFSQAKIK